MNILIAVSAGKQGATAVAWGYLLAQFTGSIPTLLTVVKNESERTAGQAMLEMMTGLGHNGTAVPTLKVVVGRAVDEIAREAQRGKYDLLVVGTRPYPPLFKRFVGSVTSRVLQQAACPILVAKNCPDNLCRILICEGGRDPSLLQRFITKLPDFIRDGSEIKVLHVMSQILANPAVPGWELQADAQTLIDQHAPEGELLQEDVRLLAIAPVPVATAVRHGLVVDEIVAEAGNGRYDLIAIGRHQGSNWWLADLMEQIVAQADPSVLVV